MSYNNYGAFAGYPGTNRFYPQYPNQTTPPTYPQQSMYPQQNQTPPLQQVPSEIPIQEIRYLKADEIKGYIVDPGRKSMLIDKENGLVHIKWCDMAGNSAVRMFSFKELDDKDIPSDKKLPEIDLEQFVKKEDLEKIGFLTAEDLKKFSIKVGEKLESLEKKIKISNFLEEEDK